MSSFPETSAVPSGPVAGLNGLLFAALAGTMAMMAFVAVVGPVVRQLGLPEWVAGLAVTAGGVFWMLLARAWGRVSDRRGRKHVLVVGFGAFSLAYLILAVGVDLALEERIGALAVIALLVAMRALIGAVYAAVPPAAAAFIADHTPPPERPARMARLGSANAVGMVIGPAAVGALAAYDLGLALYGAAFLPLLALMAIVCALQPSVPPQASGPRAGGVKLFDPRLRLACVTALIAMSAVAVAQVLVGFVAIDRLGLDAQAGARAGGLALAAVGLALIVAQQFVMRLKAVPLARWLWLGASIAGLGFLSVPLVQTQSQLLLCYGTAAFGMGFVFPTFQALAANAVQKHEQGAAAGTVSAAQGLGMVLAPLCGTLLYRIAPGAPYLLVGGLLLALAAFVLLRPRHCAAA